MAILRLHHDTPISDYTYYPVIELDINRLIALGASITWSNIDGDLRAVGCVRDFASDYIFSALSADAPRRSADVTNILANNNQWILRDGVYERNNTIMTAMDVGAELPNYAVPGNYYTRQSTTITVDGVQRVLYWYTPAWLFYSRYEQYYRDDSDGANRMIRKFYTDAGLGFTVQNGSLGTTPMRETAFPAQGSGNYSGDRQTNNYWTVDGVFFNFVTGGTAQTNYDKGLFSWYNQGGANFLTPSLITNFFAHFAYDGRDYYGLCMCKMSGDSDDATPTTITLAFFDASYWGDSVIAGGTIPAGSWGPSSEQSGGTSGTWDYSSDTPADVPASYLPTAIFSGSVIKCYAINSANQTNLAARLYNSASSLWTSWENKMYSPSSALIAMHYLPVEFSGNYDGANLSTVSMAGLTLDQTGTYSAVQAYPQTAQWRDSPTYTLAVPAIADNFVDYTPYTKMALHIPFCGVVDIDPATVTGGTIAVRLRCDALTGNIGARIVTTDKFGASSMMYASGNCAYSIPIMGKGGGAIGMGTIGGLVGAGAGLATLASGNLVVGGAMVAGGLAGSLGGLAQESATKAGVLGDIGTAAPLLDLSLWLEISRTIESSPAQKQSMRGVPANSTVMLMQLEGTGLAKIADVHLDGIDGATSAELSEIEQLLKNGVIF